MGRHKKRGRKPLSYVNKEFNKQLKNFQNRLEKYKHVQGVTFSEEYYNLEREINDVLRGREIASEGTRKSDPNANILVSPRKIRGLAERLKKTVGERERNLFTYYNLDLDRYETLPEHLKYDKSYTHDLYTLDVQPFSKQIDRLEPAFIHRGNEIYIDPVTHEMIDIKTGEIIETQDVLDYDTTLLNEVHMWFEKKPQGIAKEVLDKINSVLDTYNIEKVVKIFNQNADKIPDLNANTTYQEMEMVYKVFETIENTIGMTEDESKRITSIAEEYEEI